MASWVNQEGLLPNGPMSAKEEIPLMIFGSHLQHFVDCRVKKLVYDEIYELRKKIIALTKIINPNSVEQLDQANEVEAVEDGFKTPDKPIVVKKPRAPRKKAPSADGVVVADKVKKPRAPRKKKEPVVKAIIVDNIKGLETEESEEEDV